MFERIKTALLVSKQQKQIAANLLVEVNNRLSLWEGKIYGCRVISRQSLALSTQAFENSIYMEARYLGQIVASGIVRYHEVTKTLEGEYVSPSVVDFLEEIQGEVFQTVV